MLRISVEVVLYGTLSAVGGGSRGCVSGSVHSAELDEGCADAIVGASAR